MKRKFRLFSIFLLLLFLCVVHSSLSFFPKMHFFVTGKLHGWFSDYVWLASHQYSLFYSHPSCRVKFTFECGSFNCFRLDLQWTLFIPSSVDELFVYCSNVLQSIWMRSWRGLIRISHQIKQTKKRKKSRNDKTQSRHNHPIFHVIYFHFSHRLLRCWVSVSFQFLVAMRKKCTHRNRNRMKSDR